MGDRSYHHGSLPDALVGEAVRQVRESGGERVTLRGVAKSVGVSPSAAYNHFADKDALLQAVGSTGHDELDRRMTAAAAEGGDDDAAAILRLRRLAQAYIAFACEDPNLFRHAFGPHCVLAGGDGSAATQSRAYALLEMTLDDLDARGLLQAGAREGLDLALWSMVHGFAGLALDGLCPWEDQTALLDSIERAMLTESALDLRPRVG
jgi:AcrR family transcriptional regulator